VEYLWDTRTDSDGVYVWEARAWDDSGNMGASPSLLVRVKNNPGPPPEDTTPPVINWLSPQAGDTLEGTVELRFQVLDDVGLDSAKIYLNGRLLQNFADGGQFFDCRVNWITSDYPDGNYIVEVRAWDSAQNLGLSDPLSVTVWNNRPRVIWVPDDYEKIQDAINASEDGDTVRVRAGTYYEGLRLISKKIWMESEMGPEQTFIDAYTSGYSSGIRVYGDQTNSTIRGFTVTGEENGIATTAEGSLKIYNCIINDDSNYIVGIFLNDGDNKVLNCIVNGTKWGILVGYISGEVFNSMFINCDIGYYQIALYENWVTFGWNLFWENDRNYRVEVRNDEPQDSDIFENPRFVEGRYSLQANSPAIDSGNPDILDRDGSRSDIGIYGGLYAY